MTTIPNPAPPVMPAAGPRRRAVVSLLRPPVVVLPLSLASHGPTPPIGLAYIAAVLRDAGHEVQLIDGAGEAIDRCVEFESPVGTLNRIGLSATEIVGRMRRDTTVVGITNMFLHEWPQVRELATEVRLRFPDALIVLGGENATAFSSWMLQGCTAVDCCVLGEGEATMLEIVDRHAAGRPLTGLPGVAVRTTGGVEDTGLSIRLRKPELNALPRPAWDLVPLHNYWSRDPFFGVNRGRAMQVLGTRGCPYQCSFCSSPNMWTTKFVVRDPEDVADEIDDYVRRFGVENINFVDLTAATNRKWTLGLCDAIEARSPGITWQLPVGTRIEGIDREVLQRLYDTGCRNITFAPESGSERMLDVMNKRASLSHILESVADAHAVGLRTTVNIIIGHPDERWSDVVASARFLVRAAWRGGDDTAVIMFCPYPGSADFDALVESGRHTIDEASLYVGLSRSSRAHRTWNPSMSATQLRVLQMALIAMFYTLTLVRRPVRILEFVRSQLTGRENTYIEQMVRTRRKRIRPDAATVPVDRVDEPASV